LQRHRPGVQLKVASGSGKAATVPHALSEVYEDYAEALRRSPAEVVYISLHNSAHYGWATKSLESGRHVNVDKPAFLTLRETEKD
jgi:predicted dehydrogenase